MYQSALRYDRMSLLNRLHLHPPHGSTATGTALSEHGTYIGDVIGVLCFHSLAMLFFAE